jgi:hypothetical protein
VPRVPFRRRRGAIEAALDPGEAELLRGLCRQLSDLLDAGQDPDGPGGADPALERLFPRAYLDPTEEEAEAEWQRLVHGDLMDGRRRALAAMERSLDTAGTTGTPRTPGGPKGRLVVVLTDEEAEAWLAVLNDARLTLGSRLEVTEDFDLSGLDPADPETAPYAVYWWLGLLEERLVAVLSR